MSDEYTFTPEVAATEAAIRQKKQEIKEAQRRLRQMHREMGLLRQRRKELHTVEVCRINQWCPKLQAQS